MPPDTFFSGAPHWTWFIVPYFYVGGLAGGAYFLAALLEWFGQPDDRPVIRTGYRVAAWGAIVSGVLLTIDLGRPLRFWHMLFQSANLPAIMFKPWSPISFGAWAILLFGLFAVLSALGSAAEEGRLQAPLLRAVGSVVRGGVAKLVAAVGGLLGFFVAGYTGVLLSVTNRPIWSDSPWLGALFVASGASTGAAALILSRQDMSPTALKADILQNVDQLPSLSGLIRTGGRLNICRALPGCTATTTGTFGLSSIGPTRTRWSPTASAWTISS